MTLIQTGKIGRFPIILYGEDYWKGLIDWMKSNLMENYKTISPEDLNLYRLVNTPEEAVAHIDAFYQKYMLKPNF
jgi:hypothetical protein